MTKQEKMEKIYERRSMKDELKEKVMEKKDINHQMLKEVHNLRYENVQNNLVKEQEKKK
jgi:ATP phosphoribosyltransferase regulatory subunit HisZ